MINTEPGKKLGRIYVPSYYNKDQIGAITGYLLIAPIKIIEHQYNLEIIGISEYFDGLQDMENVPTYDLNIRWVKGAARVIDIKLTRIRDK